MSKLLSITISGELTPICHNAHVHGFPSEEEAVTVDVEYDGDLNLLDIVDKLSKKVQKLLEEEKVEIKDLTYCR